MNTSSIQFIDKEAELRYQCLLIAKDLTNNPSAAIDAAMLFVAYIEGTLSDDNVDIISDITKCYRDHVEGKKE